MRNGWCSSFVTVTTLLRKKLKLHRLKHRSHRMRSWTQSDGGEMRGKWSVLAKRPIAVRSGMDAIRWWRTMRKSNDVEVGAAEKSQPSDPVPEEWTTMRRCGNLDEVDQEKP
jgi:hypothetical protein